MAQWLQTTLLLRKVLGSFSDPLISDTVPPPPRYIFGGVLPRRLAAALGRATRFTSRRNTASIKKIFFVMFCNFSEFRLFTDFFSLGVNDFLDVGPGPLPVAPDLLEQ